MIEENFHLRVAHLTLKTNCAFLHGEKIGEEAKDCSVIRTHRLTKII